MSKNGRKENPPTPSGETGFKEFITISALKTNEGFHTIQMYGFEIRVLIEDGNPWFVVQDLSKMFGVNESTIRKRIDNNPEDFDGWHCLKDVTSSRKNSPGIENLKHSLLLVNEQAVYLIMGGLSTKRIKNPEARDMVRQFKRAFPELLKMIRTGELIVVKNEEWDLKRYLSKDGYKRVSKSIHDFINNLARNPEHEVHVHTNNAIMVNKIVFGKHFKGIRDTATVKQLEAVFALDSLNSSLIEQGVNVQKDRQKILTDYYNRHFGEMRELNHSHSLVFCGCES